MKEDFYNFQAQTTPHPLAIEISRAEGAYIYDNQEKKYLDFVAGVSANSLGHNPPRVIQAIQDQLSKYMHVMVYGEFIQKPSLQLCKLLANYLPESLSTTYLTNSGTEATEGAMKLAKKWTGRSELIACKNGYHGNTQGAMSISGAEQQNSAFRPLIPGVRFVEFNNENHLQKITHKTAAVLMETIQGGAGFIVPQNDYLVKVRKRCDDVGALFILDEIQTGFGRTGKLFGFENYHCIPDVLITGKGLGGGMPIGAFISSKEKMAVLKEQPTLGHITTFGGHPVIAAAALATLQEITEGNLMNEALRKEKLIRSLLVHPEVKEIRGVGLMLALLVKNPATASEIILKCLEKGLILFWLLFEENAIRITPPLTITDDEIREGCSIILEAISEINRS